MTILENLEWRGLLHDCTAKEELASRLEKEPIILYAGFDPTADSLHVGNLVPLIALRRFQNFGHAPIALAGGATGSIGDPSGKKSERQLLSQKTLENNIATVRAQLSSILDFSEDIPNTARLVDNNTWMAPISYLDFLRDIGKLRAKGVGLGRRVCAPLLSVEQLLRRGGLRGPQLGNLGSPRTQLVFHLGQLRPQLVDLGSLLGLNTSYLDT